MSTCRGRVDVRDQILDTVAASKGDMEVDGAALPRILDMLWSIIVGSTKNCGTSRRRKDNDDATTLRPKQRFIELCRGDDGSREIRGFGDTPEHRHGEHLFDGTAPLDSRDLVIFELNRVLVE